MSLQTTRNTLLLHVPQETCKYLALELEEEYQVGFPHHYCPLSLTY